MIQTSFSADTDIFEAIERDLGKSPRLFETAIKRQNTRFKRRILKVLRQYPGPPSYPIRWKSERQRRYVMAKLRRENNLPYQRTGRLRQGWKVDNRITPGGGYIEVFNEVPYARFVQGDDAQPFHLDTGWTQAAPVIANERARLEDVLIETYLTIVDPLAGVPR